MHMQSRQPARARGLALAALAGLLLASSTLTGCATEAEDPPDAPKTAGELITKYETQTGTLTTETARALIAGYYADFESLQLALDFVAVVGAAQQGFDNDGTEESSEGLEVKRQALSYDAGAWARLTYICPGNDDSVVDESKGNLELTAVFDTGGLRDDVIWGEASDCEIASEDTALVFDGDLLLEFQDYEAGQYVFGFEGGVKRNGMDLPLAFDVQRAGDTLAQARLGEGKRFLVGVADDALTVTDASGVWACTSSDGQSGTCSHDGKEVTW